MYNMDGYNGTTCRKGEMLRIAVVLFLAFACGGARAGSTGMAQAPIKAMQSEDTEAKDFPSLGWRTSTARAMLDYCEAVLARIPRNSPREEEWVNAEVDAARPHVFKRPEYARSLLVRTFSDCVRESKQVVESQDLRVEIMSWLKLIKMWHGASTRILGLMVQAKMTPAPPRTGTFEDHFGTTHIWVHTSTLWEAVFRLLNRL